MHAENENGEGHASSPFALAAGALTACGLFPIPLSGKRPAIAWQRFQGRRLMDFDWDMGDRYIGRWWERPDPYNLGVLTGADVFIDETLTRTLVVVDLDDQDARDLVERTCGWPLTPTVRTAHGWHLWLLHNRPVGNRTHVGDVGLDIRGAGGLALVPPSIHPNGGSYAWEVSPFVHEGGMWPPASMPLELDRLIWPKPRPRVAIRRQTKRSGRLVSVALDRELEAVRSAVHGTRNDQLNRSAYAIARFIPQIAAEVLESEFVAAATDAGLGESEARATIRSAIKGRT